MPDPARHPPSMVLDADGIRRSLRRMASEILERHGGLANLALVGIRRGGIPLSDRLRTLLLELEGASSSSGSGGPPTSLLPTGTVDITLYRDDAATALPNPRIGRSDIAFDVTEKVVVLVDDVLFTGRTIRAAIDALLDYGRPKVVQLAVLIDRGHRELPIQPDFLGRAVTTARDAHVDVRLDAEDGSPDAVLLFRPEDGSR